MAAPNTEGRSNPEVVTGGTFGVILGNATSNPVGFYGSTGTVKQTLATVTTTTLYNALVSLGLVA
jgi:hypothetical protein